MFQTEIILFLQSFSTKSLDFFFTFLSEVSVGVWIFLVVVFLTFGLRFRIGLIIANAVIWNGIITMFLKELVALPRPCNVDRRVRLLGLNLANPSPFKNGGAQSFLGMLPQEIVDAIRRNPFDSWGFPSGHTSNTVVLWGSISRFYKKTWVRVLAVAVMVLIPLSRLYLGRHFLADVLGGYVLGLIIVSGFSLALPRINGIMTWLEGTPSKPKNKWVNTSGVIILMAIPCLLLLVPRINLSGVAYLLGFNLGLLLLRSRGLPADDGTALQRILRVIIAVAIFLVTRSAISAAGNFLFPRMSGRINLMRIVPAMALMLWGSTEISLRLGLFQRKKSRE